MNLYKFKNILVPEFAADQVNPTAKYAIELSQKISGKLYFLKVITSDILDALKEDMELTSDKEIEKLTAENDSKYLNKIALEGYDINNIQVITKISHNIEEGLRFFIDENDISLVILDRQLNVRNNRILETCLKTEVQCLIQKQDYIADIENIRIMIPCDNRKRNLSCICQGVSIAKHLGGSVIFFSEEDHPAKIIRPRLDAHEADSSKVFNA